MQLVLEDAAPEALEAVEECEPGVGCVLWLRRGHAWGDGIVYTLVWSQQQARRSRQSCMTVRGADSWAFM